MADSLIIWTLHHRTLGEIIGRVVDLLGYLLVPIAAVMHRRRSLWVFGYKTGFCDNPKYLFLHTLRHHPDIQAVWIARTRQEQKQLKELHLPCRYKWSVSGLWTCLRAKVYVFACDASDINYWTSARAIKVNLWHGVGVKNLGYKGDVTYNAHDRMNRLLTPAIYDRPTYFITTSELMNQHFTDCFALTAQQTRQIGYPRCDFLQAGDKPTGEYINTYESVHTRQLAQRMNGYRRVYIYMPTFRDDQSDFFTLSGINLAELNELMLQQEALFLIKIHPATRTAVAVNNYSNIILLDKLTDIYPLLPRTDVLITDYSSIYYDYQLMPGKRILLFPFDYDSYISNSRQMAYNYDQYTPGDKYYTWNDLKQAIMHIEQVPVTPDKWVVDMFWGTNYHNSSEQIIHLIQNT